jgi:hypothetical protein
MAQCKEAMSVRNKQRAVIEFLTTKDVSPIDIHWRIEVVCWDVCVDISIV